MTLTSPAGTRTSAQFDVGGAVPGFTWAGGPLTVVGIPLMWPATAAEGSWKLSVEGVGLRRTTTITVSTRRSGDGMELPASPLDSFNPFDTLDDGPLDYALSFPVNERIQFSGAGYPADTRIPLGIYRSDKGDFTLVHSEMLTTDGAGRFKTTYRIPDTLTAGLYWAAAGLLEFWHRMGEENGPYDILGNEGSRRFYVRGGIDAPAPSLLASTYQHKGEPLQILLQGFNLGRSATPGPA